MMRTTTRRAAAATVLGGIVVASALGLGSTAAVADDEDGIGLSVTISPSPTPTSTAPAGGTGTGGSTTRPGTSTSGTTTPADSVEPASDAEPVLADDEVDLGGVLYISGLSSSYGWSINPLDGESETSFTVRNVSNTTFSSTADFWLDGPFGNRVSEAKGVRITDLKPGESRIVDATLGGIGQWTFVNVHATLRPPKTVEGVELDSITRDKFVVVLPWGVLGIGALGGLGYAGYAAVRWIREPYVPARLAGASA